MTKNEREKIVTIWIRTMNNCEFYEKEGNTKMLLNEIGVLRGLYYVQNELGINICLYRHFEHFISIQNKETCKLRSKNKGEKIDKTN